jgi:hypothetical protein
MASEQITVQSWEPSPRQLALLNKYALGYSWHRAAQMEEIPVSTYQRWLQERPELRELGADMRRAAMENIAEVHQDLIRKCYAVLERVGDGDSDLAPDDQLARWAERILSKTTWPVVVAQGFASAGAALNGQQSLRLIEGAS